MQGEREEAALSRRNLRREGRCFRELKGFQPPLISCSGDIHFCQLHAKLGSFFKRQHKNHLEPVNSLDGNM